MVYLLDTSALLAHYRQELGWEAVQRVFDDDGATLLLASPSLPELARRLVDLEATEAEIQAVVTSYRLLTDDVVSIDVDVAMTAFDIGRQAARRIPLIDALIAAAAKHHQARLVHRDEHLRAISADLVSQVWIADQP